MPRAVRYGGAALCTAFTVRVPVQMSCRRAVSVGAQCVPPLAPRLWAHEDRFVHLAVTLLVEPFFDLVQPVESSAEVQCSAVQCSADVRRSLCAARTRPDHHPLPRVVRGCASLAARVGTHL